LSKNLYLIERCVKIIEKEELLKWGSTEIYVESSAGDFASAYRCCGSRGSHRNLTRVSSEWERGE